MDAIGPETERESQLRLDERRFRVVTIVAAVIYAPFLLGHLAFATVGIGSFEQMFASMGGELPVATQILIRLSHFGVLAILLLAVDVAVFVGMRELAKRYWIGLLFAPLFLQGVLSAAMIPLLYLPMFNVISLVK